MKRQVFYILLFIPVFTSCLESPEMTTGIVNGKEKPTVISGQTEIPLDGALLFQGEIVSKGKSEIIEKGFYWSTVSQNPDSTDNIITLNANTNIFSYELKNAKGEKTYYWRAFARNSFGFDYGGVQSCNTPEIWEVKQELPANSRGRGAISLYNNKIYMTCGQLERGNIYTNSTWIYDIETKLWKEAATFTGESRTEPVIFSVEDMTFVGTGIQAYGYAHKDFYRYNNTLDNWTKIDMPEDFEARYGSVAFSLNGKGYVVGGYSYQSGILNEVWQYALSTTDGLWTKMDNDFPFNFYLGISISGNNRCFVGFGVTSETRRTLWEYDDETDSWEMFITLPDEVGRTIYSGVIIQNSMYIVDEKNIIWTLDMDDETKTWKKKANLPLEFLNVDGEGGFQNMLTSGNSNSIYVGLGFSKYLYEYRPLWDN